MPDLGLHIVTDYVLSPDTPLMKVTTTLTATAGDATVVPGDVLMSSQEVVDLWDPGVGLAALQQAEVTLQVVAAHAADLAAGAIITAEAGRLRVRVPG